jgi:hypothetical protein
MKKTVPVLALIVGIAAAGAAAYFATTGKAQFGPTPRLGLWGGGGLGLLLGLIGAAKGKKKRKTFAIIGLILSIGAIGATFAPVLATGG